MNSIIQYIAESLLTGFLFWLLFRVASEKGFSYNFQRLYLLVSSSLVLLLPLVKIPLNSVISMPSIELPAIMVVPDAPPAPYSEMAGVRGIVILLYLTVVFITMLRLILQLTNLSAIYFKGVAERRERLIIVRNSSVKSPFSIYRFVFLPPNTESDAESTIIAHEEAHFLRGHSADLLFMNILRSLLWFNPFIHILYRKIVSLHEYQADSDVIDKGADIAEYQKLILNLQFGLTPQIANSLHNSLTVKRFRKMKTMTKKRNSPLAVIATTLATMAIVVFVSCIYNYASAENPSAGTLVSDEVVNSPALAEQPQEKEKVIKPEYLTVMPKFQGGDMTKFVQWVAQNVQYPAEAKAKKIQGKVIASFILSKEGKIIKARILEGVNELLDKETLRVINSSPDWTPGYLDGKPQNVEFAFPLVFKLN